MKNLTGIVEECRTRKPPVSQRAVTELKILSFENGDVLKMQMFGRHRIDREEVIKVHYTTYSGMNWISHYDILDDNCDVLYSGVRD